MSAPYGTTRSGWQPPRRRSARPIPPAAPGAPRCSSPGARGWHSRTSGRRARAAGRRGRSRSAPSPAGLAADPARCAVARAAGCPQRRRA
ncbi:MAG: hypothetical protein DYG91_12350 [Chloroflexi bacterium CFX7]|nr:MAG: hypothetical protein EDM76_02120 [bacterium]MCE7929267.1 hypothetical protein [Chloroflexi bacterium CFX7]